MSKDSSALNAVEVRNVKCSLRRASEPFVRGGAIFEQARNSAQLTREQAADHYGTSPSLLTRQVSNQDNQHLSFQRMCEMPAKFQQEAIRAWAAALDGVTCRTVIEISGVA